MTDNHPIIPPLELVEQWIEKTVKDNYIGIEDVRDLVNEASQWGADQELEACYEWLCSRCLTRGADEFLAVRRPKPPSPKEEALQVLENLIETRRIVDPEYQTLRHALEQLDD